MSLYPTDNIEAALGSTRASPVPRIVLVGASYRTADIDFRERFAGKLKGIGGIAQTAGLREYAVLQTCNRVELYGSTGPDWGADSIIGQLGYGKPEGFYLKSNLDAIIHLFSVAAGLESVALGESQISRQVRAAGLQARTSGNAKSVLTPLFDAAYTSSDRVRKRFQLASGGQSLSEVALRFAFGRLEGAPSDVLVVGTGETARLAALRLKGAKIHLLTRRRGGGRLIPGSVRVAKKSLRNVIAKCELVICATKNASHVITVKDIPDTGKRVLLDLGFPRNIDPAVRSMHSADLIDLDDVASLAGRDNVDSKLGPARKAIEAEAVRFYAWLTATRLNPALASIYRWAERVREDEAATALRRLPKLSEQERKVVEVMSRSLVSRLMAPHAEFVKGDSSPEDQQKKLRLLEEIFPVDPAP